MIAPNADTLAPALEGFSTVSVITDHKIHRARVEYEPGTDVNRLVGSLQRAGWGVLTIDPYEKAIIVGERPPTPAEEAAAESEAYDREHAAEVEGERAVAHRIVADLRSNAVLLTRTLTRLDEGGLYDVEYVDTGGPSTAKAALDQIAVALAALSAVIPEPGQ